VKLAIIRRRYAPHGGAERFIETGAREFANAGIEVSLIAESWTSFGGDSFRRITVPGGGLTRASRLAHFQHAIADIVAREGFDLVQTHERLLTADIFRAGDGVHAAWVARQAAERGGLRGAIMRLDPLHRLVIDTERRMARETDMIFVANSALVAREIAEWLTVPASRIRTIENGVDLAAFHVATDAERQAARARFGIGPDEPVVAFVGSGFERKGAFRLVEALAQPAARPFHALIAGADRHLKALQARVVALGLAARVRILGGVADPRSVYRAADVFALPSLYDPMPNAALEALACGLPVVTTADAGIAEAVAEAKAGTIATRDPQSIAEGLTVVAGQRAAMSSAARALARRFDLNAATARWLALYRELA
jgi:UDP-glucose:(heptosyl)LPS alpha-1,3-glucosyltransferase